MGYERQTFTKPRSLAMMQLIMAHLEAHGASTSNEIMQVTGLTQPHNCTYLKHMARKEMIHCVAASGSSQNGRMPAVWALGRAGEDLEPSGASTERKVIVRQQWEPNHVRMPMECYLFGVPRAPAHQKGANNE